MSPADGSRVPRFTLISAVYNVGRYLDEFIASIEAQSLPLDRVEVIMVDDGSTDDSLERLEDWRRRRPQLVTVLTKANGGQGSARNLGLEHARGEWVTFPDPDDVLESGYLAEVDAFLTATPAPVMVATKRVLFDDATGARGGHPLDYHFTRTNRLRNLDIDGGHFHGSAPCAFFRLELLRKQELTFDARIRPTFEDGHFCCRYLLHVDTPLVAYIQSAVYLYRKRSDSSSTLDLRWTDPGCYTSVAEVGFRDLLLEGAQLQGRAPVWLQSMVLYELSWYFKVEDAVPWIATAAHGEVADRFHQLLGELLELIDQPVIEGFPGRRLKPVYRDILLHGYARVPWHPSYVIVDKIDMQQRLLRLRYRYTGDAPQARFDVDGAFVEPVADKTRSLRYFDRVMLKERIVWLPFGTVRTVFDGIEVDTRMDEPDQVTHRLGAWRMRRELDPVLRERNQAKMAQRSRADRAILRLADSRVVRRLFAKSWVLMDRVHDADDSAEHLFRYLRKHRRKTNAWFVIEAGTPDDRRLRKSVHRRVVAHGSLRWKLLMLNCQHLISTHIDREIIAPAEITRLRAPRWRYTFLQHGVIKDDLSRWMNIKDPDVFITSTTAEYESIVADGSPYKFTTREVKLTGLPRFDRLRAQSELHPPERRDLLLIAPTWRSWFMRPGSTGVHRRNADLERFTSSEFYQEWFGLIGSDRLRQLAEEHGLTIGLLLHPNLQSIAAELDVPPYVQLLTFEGQDVQAIFARARVFVTDYSSMAFNAAYIERPLVYFQFDADRFFGGGHAGVTGYFDFERDGYGPVAMTIDAATRDIADALTHGPQPQPRYRGRIEQAFPDRDGRCCERVADVIRDSTARASSS
jgi:GT2 family glycosyltransferase